MRARRRWAEVSCSSDARRSWNDDANADPTVPQPMRPRRNSTGDTVLSPSTRPRRFARRRKIPEARKAAGTRGLLAVCFTWPQYAVNHHEGHFDCERISSCGLHGLQGGGPWASADGLGLPAKEVHQDELA